MADSSRMCVYVYFLQVFLPVGDVRETKNAFEGVVGKGGGGREGKISEGFGGSHKVPQKRDHPERNIFCCPHLY